MFKERIQEIFEFTQSESPYRKANKGWINQDIFLDLSPTANTVGQDNEAAKVIFFWSPINSLLSKIFWIIIACSILVFTSISFAKGRFDLNFYNNPSVVDVIIDLEDKDLNISKTKDLDGIDSLTQQNHDAIGLDKRNKNYLLDNDLVKAGQKITNKDVDKKEILTKENKKSKSNFI